MSAEDFYYVYQSLKIDVEPLSPQYTPEEYGRNLLSMAKSECGVSYAASTDYKEPGQK
ncbi:MAG: hypothetical protein IJL60_03555 [Clostridiales bacterium]|nr:hypothetical protein [Clostridiales bacterium]MBQ5966835.1 hypothetical protein [Clostridiales bacterium]